MKIYEVTEYKQPQLNEEQLNEWLSLVAAAARTLAPYVGRGIISGSKYAWQGMKWTGRWMKGNPGKSTKFALGITVAPEILDLFSNARAILGPLVKYGIPIAILLVIIVHGKRLYDELFSKNPDDVSPEQFQEIMQKYANQMQVQQPQAEPATESATGMGTSSIATVSNPTVARSKKKAKSVSALDSNVSLFGGKTIKR
jgi:hypothetical protein|tara:strand:+ start:2193 stop:2789 length:597 start_codon:yes stop_codon:yes gene_type:complete